jgi:hypothetical protein
VRWRAHPRVLLAAAAASCHAGAAIATPNDAGAAGTLLLIGGGLDDDLRPIYQRFLALAGARGSACVVLAFRPGAADRAQTPRDEVNFFQYRDAGCATLQRRP